MNSTNTENSDTIEIELICIILAVVADICISIYTHYKSGHINMQCVCDESGNCTKCLVDIEASSSMSE